VIASDERLDLRDLPVWERAAIVAARVDSLTPGETISFITEIDPRALLMMLHEGRPDQLATDYRRIAEREWHADITRFDVSQIGAEVNVALRRSAVFSVLDDETRATLSQALVERTYRKGDVIIGDAERFAHLGLLCEGNLAYFGGPAARQRLIIEYFPLEIFGEIALFDGGSAMGRLVVLSRTARVAFIPADLVRSVAMEHPQLFATLGAVCAQRVRSLAQALTAQASQPIIARIAQALMPYAIPAPGLQPALAPLSQMTQVQIAAAAGTVKEVAARAIAELEEREALRRERGRIRYLDRTKLIEVADHE
jgi:CRP-like cAMP-binding protein